MRRYPATRLAKYPRIYGKDHKLWDLFIYINPDFLDSVFYNTTLGHGRATDPNAPENIKKNWKYLSSLKIDAIGETSTELFIYEVKYSAYGTALGQLLTYNLLFPENFVNGRKVSMTLICNDIHIDYRYSCEYYKIRIITPECLQKNYPIPYSLYK